MDANIVDIQPLKNGGWLLSVEIKQFVWRKLRFITTKDQFFTDEQDLDYSVDWYYASDGERVVDPLERELCRVTYEYSKDEERKRRLFNLDTQVISDGDMRKPIQ